MYCKHCGKEIAEDSKFCKHCGEPQRSDQQSVTIKPIWIVYFIWALVNFYLLMGEKWNVSSSYFYPSLLSTYKDVHWNKDTYDFSEFVVYVFVIPAILYVVYRRNITKIDKLINKILNK